MNTVSLIFPHQLFEHNPCLKTGCKVVLLEEPTFFQHHEFQEKPLAQLHEAMAQYKTQLQQLGFEAEHIYSTEDYSKAEKLIRELAKAGVEQIIYCDTLLEELEEKIQAAAAKSALRLCKVAAPGE